MVAGTPRFRSGSKESAMESLDRRIFGIVILALWGMLVAVKRLTTGSLLGDRPNGGVGVWLVHIFNFSFLLAANPLAAVLLIFPRKPAIAPQGLLAALGAAGMLVSAAGYILMAWALIALHRNYQVGGNPPRSSDEFVTRGPYRFVRHPMYAAAAAISMGLACLTQHLAYFCVFCIYLLLILSLIPVEERALRRAYGERYAGYQKRVKRLVPSLY